MKKAGKSGIGSARAGFTLVELMVATTILLIFGSMAVTALRYGSSLWRSGHRRGYSYDAATAVFHQLEDDIRAAKSQFWNQDADAYDPRIRFIVDYDALGRQRLRFVRGIPDDTVNPRIRQAGDGVDNDGNNGPDEEYYNLKNDDPGLPANDMDVDEDLMPLEGMCEVVYMMGLDDDDSDGWTDTTTLYRAVLAPIGDDYSLFHDADGDGDYDDNIDEATEIYDPATGGGVALPLAQNVLHFEVRLWGQYTTTWDDAAPAYSPWAESWVPEYGGPAFEWNSEGEDETDVWDNVFPRAVMVVISVNPPERLRRTNRLKLAANISGSDVQIPVLGDQPAYNTAWPYILIHDLDNGSEWIRFLLFDAANQQFIVDPNDPLGGRGVRGTQAVGHTALGPGGRNRDISFGLTFSSVFQNPACREDWGDTGE